jgi:protein-S-isoprenylcysteine O-methyltransferase Ste14
MKTSEYTNWKIKTGQFLFKFRSFTPLPLMAAVFIFFRPYSYGAIDPYLIWGGLAISFLGEFIRVMAVGFAYTGTSGRENYLRADDLNRTGIYSIVRNPLYIGNVLMFSGLLIVFANWWALLFFNIFLITQYYFIILSEENYLKQKYGDSFNDYCKTINRVIPTFNSYQKPALPFDGRKVFFKENDSVFNMLMVFVIILAFREKSIVNAVPHSTHLIVAAAVLVIIYIIIKVLKKTVFSNK